MSEAVGYGRGIAVCVLAVSYALLAHYTNTNSHNEMLGAIVALTPIVLALLAMAWHSRHRAVLLAMVGVGVALLVAAWNLVEHHFNQIYWIEHAGSQFVLFLAFGRTLAQGREPMCTYFAKMVHGSLLPEIEIYCRQVTVAWVVFFGLMAATSTVLFFTVPLATWSAFAYFFTAPLIALMFIAEYAARWILHPQVNHAHILDTITAVWKQRGGPRQR